ncbi:MAG: AAA family ATPase [Clostridiales bacterium]|nr:AAA family ATPase [Clostridiales bacterium]
MSNPYTLVFGQPPLEIIERKAQADRVISEFCEDRPSNYINLVTGIRGSGKTVFITQIANRLKEKKDWIIVNLNPQRDLLTALAAKLNSDKSLNKIFIEAQINLQALGIGIEIKGAPPITDIEEALTRMLQSIKKHKKRVLITIDEVTNSKDIRIFTSAFQIFLREGLPVFLLMTGLFSHIDRLRNAEGMTFLERAPRTVLSPLNFNAIVEKYVNTLKLKQNDAIKLATATKGYSFAFQTIGYYAWEYPNKLDSALKDAKEYLFEFAYRKIWSEHSATDRKVIRAIQQSKTGEIAQVRKILGWSSNQFNPYRDRLIKSGIVSVPQNGYVELALPWFGDYAVSEREFEE